MRRDPELRGAERAIDWALSCWPARLAIWLVTVLGPSLIVAAGLLALVLHAHGCGGCTCVETEDKYTWGSGGPASAGCCGPHPSPLTTGTAGP